RRRRSGERSPSPARGIRSRRGRGTPPGTARPRPDGRRTSSSPRPGSRPGSRARSQRPPYLGRVLDMKRVSRLPTAYTIRDREERMPTAYVNGMNIAYELHGEGEPVALTPGGRFDMDTTGVRELAQALAAGGKQVLIWDRPNTGRSDVRLDTDFESTMHADTLAALIEELGLGKTTIIGGSAGSRVSLLTAARHPEISEKLAIWWISGGFFGLILLAAYYCSGSFLAPEKGRVAAVGPTPRLAQAPTP